MKQLLIFGAGGHGKVVADTAERMGWKQILFFDDRWPTLDTLGHWPVAGGRAELISARQAADGLLVAVGDNRRRLSILASMEEAGASLVSVVHPAAVVSPYARIGLGSVLFATAVVNADAVLGRGVIINTGASVDHECILGDGVHISPGARLAGQTEIGEGTWVGIGAVVREGVRIGAQCVIGAGAVVISDIPDGQRVLGVPGKVVQ